MSPQSAGDLLVLTVINDGWPNSVSAVSGGGVSQWSAASSAYLDAADRRTLQVWYGVVTTAGPSQVDLTWTGAVQNVDLGLQELNAGTGPTWSLDDVGFSNEPFPSLSGPASDEAFVGAALAWGDAAAGPDPGAVYTVPNDDFVFAVATGTVGDPSATGAGSVAALFGATGGTAGPSETTTTTVATTTTTVATAVGATGASETTTATQPPPATTAAAATPTHNGAYDHPAAAAHDYGDGTGGDGHDYGAHDHDDRAAARDHSSHHHNPAAADHGDHRGDRDHHRGHHHPAAADHGDHRGDHYHHDHDGSPHHHGDHDDRDNDHRGDDHHEHHAHRAHHRHDGSAHVGSAHHHHHGSVHHHDHDDDGSAHGHDGSAHLDHDDGRHDHDDHRCSRHHRAVVAGPGLPVPDLGLDVVDPGDDRARQPPRLRHRQRRFRAGHGARLGLRFGDQQGRGRPAGR